MRTTLISAALALMLFGSFGCGGNNANDANTLRVGNGAEPQALDPHLVTGVTEHRILSSMFEGLVNLDPATLEPVPGMAESWEVSDDGLVYTFKIRPDAKWSDGASLTAEDFVYSIRRNLSPALASEYAYLLHPVAYAEEFNLGEIEDFSQVGVKALDPQTLEIRLTHPTPYFLSMQTHFAWYPVQQAAVEAHGAMDARGTDWAQPGSLVSNGPYVLTEWLPNEVVRVEKNPHYWNADAVRMDAIAYFPIDNEQTEERAFRSGDLHMTEDVPIHKIPVYREEQPELLVIHPYLATSFLRFNVTQPPFDEPAVREAFSLAIDREQMTSTVLKGGEAPAYTYVPEEMPDYESPYQVKFDPEAARAKLAEAGYPDGEGLPTINLLFPTSGTNKTIAEVVQRMWKQHLGVNVQLLNQDWKVYLSAMSSLNYQACTSGWISDVVDPINFLECFLSDGGNNRTGFASEEYDRLILAAYEEKESERREELLQQAEELLLRQNVVAPVFYQTRKFLKSPRLRGYEDNVLGLIRWEQLYLAPETE